MNDRHISVLYVDDEENNLLSFKATFRLRFKIFTAISGTDALEILDKNLIHVIITDQRMPHMSGVAFLEKVLEKHPDPVRVLLTGFTDVSTVIEAVNKGKIFHYLTKPWNEEELGQTIQRGYEIFQEREKLNAINEKLTVSNEQLEFLLRQKLLS